MPIRKTPEGYYWGEKGPFPTKEKAEEVERAAYASGYAEDEDDEDYEEEEEDEDEDEDEDEE
jgi:hypothetical protein